MEYGNRLADYDTTGAAIRPQRVLGDNDFRDLVSDAQYTIQTLRKEREGLQDRLETIMRLLRSAENLVNAMNEKQEEAKYGGVQVARDGLR